MYHFLYRLKWLVVANSIFVPKIVAVIYFVTFGERPAGPKGLEMFIMVFTDHNLFLGDLLPVLCYRKKIACGYFFFRSRKLWRLSVWILTLLLILFFCVRKKGWLFLCCGWCRLRLAVARFINAYCVVYLFQFIVLTKF